ncbi:MAG: SixA phosphatase family protein [Actinomycetota bacterium]
MDLVVVRHAIAEERDVLRWPDDRDRPLTPEGESRFRRAARGYRKIVSEVDVVLASPLERAWRTAQLLVEEAGWPDPKPCDALEPDRATAEMIDVLRVQGQNVVAAVGHEPHLGELISYLLTGSDRGASVELKKGAAARLELDGIIPGRSTLRWLVQPRIARASGR